MGLYLDSWDGERMSVRVYEIIKDDEEDGYVQHLRACKRNETVDTNYGMYTFVITKEDIDYLLKGRALYGDIGCGEYSVMLYMK